MDVKFPEIEVQLTGQNGNAFNLIGIVKRELRRNGVSEQLQKAFVADATSGDYDHVLQTCMQWVTVE